uniref:IgGFc_binding domain-containing protein n=1 Tax=Gongylonema pulchrum TaxID=637853 RepID=A0A183D2J1_9BILA
LPTSMASTTYVLSMPASAPGEQGRAIVYFLPIDKNITYDIKVFYTPEQGITKESSVHLESNDNGTIWVYKRTAQRYVMFVNGTGKFVVVAAVNSLPLSDDESELRTDFGCFMPTPILNQSNGIFSRTITFWVLSRTARQNKY